MPLSRVELGSIAVHLAATFPVWVKRRKTAFEILDDSTVLSRQSIDFRLRTEHFPVGLVPNAGDRIYVPVNIAPKDPLTSFSVADEDGRPLSLLNTGENGDLATEGLSAFMDGATAHVAAIAPGQFRDALGDIVMAPDGTAGKAARDQAIAQMGTALAPDAPIRPLLTELSGGFLMLVPLTYEPDAHRLIKIELVGPLEVTHDGLGGALRALAASLGFASRPLRFSHLPIGWAEGTHFEFRQPEELVLVRGRLGVSQLSTADGQVHRQDDRRVVHGRSPVNLSVAVLDRADPVSGREDTADVEVRLRSRPGGMLLSLVTTALVAAAVLLALSPQLDHLDGQTSAAVLLVVPALVFGYLNRPGEHAIATRLLAGVRALGLVAALAALGAAVLIGSGNILEKAPERPQRIDCRPVTETVGPPARRREALRDLDCTLTAAAAAEREVREAARDWMDGATRASVGVAGLMLLGALSNAAVVAWSRRRGDVNNETV